MLPDVVIVVSLIIAFVFEVVRILRLQRELTPKPRLKLNHLESVEGYEFRKKRRGLMYSSAVILWLISWFSIIVLDTAPFWQVNILPQSILVILEFLINKKFLSLIVSILSMIFGRILFRV